MGLDQKYFFFAVKEKKITTLVATIKCSEFDTAKSFASDEEFKFVWVKMLQFINCPLFPFLS